MAVMLEAVLVNGERRTIHLPTEHSGSVGNALARLDDWIKTEEGGWIQKSFIVEVASAGATNNVDAGGGSEEELRQLTRAAGTLADQGQR